MAQVFVGKSKLQIFFEKFFYTFFTLFKIFILSVFYKRKNVFKRKKDQAVILGNGPSLSENLKSNVDFILEKDIFAVNAFWKSADYIKIKPEFYIIISEGYWADYQIPLHKEDRLNTFKSLAQLTDWDMYLIVPFFARKKKKWQDELSVNKKIKIRFINITPVEGFNLTNRFFFRKKLGLPRPHNVLIPTIKTTIDLSYEKVYIFGADHSWLNNIFVAEDNKVYLSQKHFYDKERVDPSVMYKKSTKENRTLAEVLHKFVNTFNGYHLLEDYAKSKKVKIYNATEKSYIDAFERIKI